MLNRKDYRTIKGFVDFTWLTDEQGNKFHLINGHSLYGHVNYGYYLIIPLQSNWWRCIRKVVLSTEIKKQQNNNY